MTISFCVSGKPQGKSRPRFSSRSGAVYTPRKTKAYESRIAIAYHISGGKMFTGKVQVRVFAYFKIPDSWPKKKKEEAADGRIIPGKPDIDNILKVVLDGLNGYAYADDKCVAAVTCSKWYAADGREGIYVFVVGQEETK